MTLKKTYTSCAIAAATLSIAGALVSPQAFAGSKADRVAEAAINKVDALEAQLQAMQAEINSLRAAAAPQTDAKVQELDEWMQQVKSAPVKVDTKDNMVFFRGGYARNDHKRDGVSIYSDVAGSQLGFPGQNGDNEGWYMGAGFDFSVNDNLFGLMDDTEVLAELMFDWKEFSTATQGNVLAQDPTWLAANQLIGPIPPGAIPTREVSVSQFTISAAPKIKFMKGSDFRPWIIPVGMAFHVISPPSESITVFNPGVMFGGGADYKVWKDIYVGVDGRYHLTGGAGDGVNTDGFTAGGYVGLGF